MVDYLVRLVRTSESIVTISGVSEEDVRRFLADKSQEELDRHAEQVYGWTDIRIEVDTVVLDED